jgi:hypothetical protein
VELLILEKLIRILFIKIGQELVVVFSILLIFDIRFKLNLGEVKVVLLDIVVV